MSTTTYNIVKAKEVENAVMQVFQCNTSEIICNSDTIYKKVVVFVLNKLLGYDKRIVALNYEMTYLYVPTVVDEIEFLFLLDQTTRNKITEVTKIIGYASQVDKNRIGIA